jgi:hypothetical protein
MPKSKRRRTFGEIVVAELDRRCPRGEPGDPEAPNRKWILENLFELAREGYGPALQWIIAFQEQLPPEVEAEEDAAPEANVFRAAAEKYRAEQKEKLKEQLRADFRQKGLLT